MKIEDVLARERANSTSIYLHRDGEFLVAYQVSAYLVQLHYWPDLRPTYKIDKTYGECIRVGFPIASFNKVLLQIEADGVPIEEIGADEQKPDMIIIGPVECDQQAYLRWRQEFLSSYNQAKEMMKPFYGALPVYKKSYDLMTQVVSVVRKFPKELHDIIGSRLVGLMMEINAVFQRACQTDDIQWKIDLITQIGTLFDQMTFLLRLAFDQRAFGLDRSVELMGQISDIRQQLTMWQKKLSRKALSQVPTHVTA